MHRIAYISIAIIVSIAFACLSQAEAAAPKTATSAMELMATPPDGYELARHRKYAAARQWAIEKLKDNPKDTDSLFLKACMETFMKEPQMILETTSKLLALKSNPFAYQTHKMRADAYVYLENYPEAMKEIDEAVRLMPHEWAPLQLRWRLKARLGKQAEADRDHRVRAILSQLYFTWDNALDESLKSTTPSRVNTKSFQEEYAAGQRAFSRLAFQEAADYFTRVLAMKPETLDAYLYRAQAFELLEKWSFALPDLTHLIEQGDNKMIPLRAAPDNVQKVPFAKWVMVELPMAEVYKRRARCYAGQKKYTQALADLDIALEHQPSDRWIWEGRGIVLSESKKYKEALVNFRRAERLDPTNPSCTIRIIKSCMASGDYGTAITRISWLLKDTPTDEVLLFKRAEALSHLGFHKEAIKDLSLVISSKPRQLAECYLKRAHEYEESKDFENASGDYTKALTLFNENMFNENSDGKRRALAGRERTMRKLDGEDTSDLKSSPLAKQLINTPPDGYQLARAQKSAEAKEWAVTRIKSNPNDAEAWFLKAWMEIILKQPRHALESCTKLLSLKSHMGHAHKFKALSYYMLDDPLNALSEFNEALKLMPNEESLYDKRSLIYQGMRKRADADREHKIRLILSQLYCAWDKVTESNYEDARPSPARKTSFPQEYAAGQKAFARFAFQASADYFSRVIELKPDCWDAYLYRAQALEALDKWSTALTDLNFLISQGASKMIPLRVAPDDVRKVPFEKWTKIELPMAEAYKRRARCYASMQKHALAIEDLNVAVRQQPEDRWTVESRGNAYSGFKKYREAIKDYTIAEHLEPTYVNCHAKIIECCMNGGDYKNAIVRISWHLKNSPADDVMLLERASALSHLGFHKEAIDDLTSIMLLSSDYIEAYLRRAKEYETVGIPRKALKDYTKALSLDKDNQKALAGRDRVSRLLQRK